MDDADRVELVAETLRVDKQSVETGRVRVRTFVDEEIVRLDETLRREAVEVERVAIGREVDVAPAVREDGEFIIIPVLEERLVIEKRLFLVEEVRLRRTATTVPFQTTATRRVMRAEVDRQTPAPSGDDN